MTTPRLTLEEVEALIDGKLPVHRVEGMTTFLRFVTVTQLAKQLLATMKEAEEMRSKLDVLLFCGEFETETAKRVASEAQALLSRLEGKE